MPSFLNHFQGVHSLPSFRPLLETMVMYSILQISITRKIFMHLPKILRSQHQTTSSCSFAGEKIDWPKFFVNPCKRLNIIKCCIKNKLIFICFHEFPHSSVNKESAYDAGIHLQCRKPWFDSWVQRIFWKKKWQPTPVFLPGKWHGQRSLAGYSSWSCKESDMT